MLGNSMLWAPIARTPPRAAPLLGTARQGAHNTQNRYKWWRIVKRLNIHEKAKDTTNAKTRNADASASGAASADAPSPGRLRRPQQCQLTEHRCAQGVALLACVQAESGPRPDACGKTANASYCIRKLLLLLHTPPRLVSPSGH